MKHHNIKLIIPCLVLCGFFFSCRQTDVKSHTSSTDKGLTDTVEVVEDEVEATNPPLSSPEQQLSYMEKSDSSALYKTGILPQMAKDAPSYCQKILESDGKRFIVVDKAKMKLFVYDPYGNIIKSCSIACARNYGTRRKQWDSRTTEGIFEIKAIEDATNWLFTNEQGITSPTKGVYGPRFIRLSTPAIGIHGTGSPSSIGKRCSHGCIRVTNANILEIVELAEVGMPVIISPGPYDMAVNNKEGNPTLAVVTEPGTPKAEASNYAPAQYSGSKSKTLNEAEQENTDEEIIMDVAVPSEMENSVESTTPASRPESSAEKNSSENTTSSDLISE